MTTGRGTSGSGYRGSRRGRGSGNTGNRNHGSGPGRGRGGGRGGRSSGGRAYDGTTTTARKQKLPSNPSNLQFIRSVLRSCPNHRLKETLEQLEKPWLSCWQEVDRLPLEALQTLLSALERLPFSVSSIERAPLSAISKAVGAMLTQATQVEENAFDGNDNTLESVALADGSLNIRLKRIDPCEVGWLRYLVRWRSRGALK
uniref:Uncharacterized protein n=1 Tax=Hyaloperonospora arabidopsidis (strain Emoy2) TaxID=559515 RepID=M4BU43_HYAAE